MGAGDQITIRQAARNLADGYDLKMLSAIQQAYYLRARNPSDEETLVELAQELGLDSEQFKLHLVSEQTKRQLAQEIELSRQLEVYSFPSLVLEHSKGIDSISINYLDTTPMLNEITQLLDNHE